MTPIIKKIAILALLVATPLLSGCSFSKNSPPSRAEAEKMILAKRTGEKFYKTPIGGEKEELFHLGSGSETAKWYMLCTAKNDPEAMTEDYALRDTLKKLADAGFVKINSELSEDARARNDRQNKDCFEYDFTDQMKPYLTEKNSPIMAELKAVSVSEMTAPADMLGKKTITATYKIVPELTPIGKIFYKDADDFLKGTPHTTAVKGDDLFGIDSAIKNNGTGKVTLVLYDDGWKIDHFNDSGS